MFRIDLEAATPDLVAIYALRPELVEQNEGVDAALVKAVVLQTLSDF